MFKIFVYRLIDVSLYHPYQEYYGRSVNVFILVHLIWNAFTWYIHELHLDTKVDLFMEHVHKCTKFSWITLWDVCEAPRNCSEWCSHLCWPQGRSWNATLGAMAFIAFDQSVAYPVIVYCKCWCVITFIKRTHNNPNINWYSIFWYIISCILRCIDIHW